jgi:primosomal protein N' (replication factor Y)
LSLDLKVNSDFRAETVIARVALDVPIAPWFDYRVAAGLVGSVAPGDWVIVPWGKVRRVGLVIELAQDSPIAPERLRDLIGRLDDAPLLPQAWWRVVRFAGAYYHKNIGEIALPAIPKSFRTLPRKAGAPSPFARARARSDAHRGAARYAPTADATPPAGLARAALSPGQQGALDDLVGLDGFSVRLLYGVTGSGKTEVYLRWFETLLVQKPQAQLLLLVPEIALTPQLARQVKERFHDRNVVVLHSGVAASERSLAWLDAAEGRAQVVIGTRLAVLTPLPKLAGIVVDEEHDPSYRQQEGVHYSARDLAVVAGRQAGVPVLLGSATPSLESWRAAQRGRYRLLEMPVRIGEAALPVVETIDLRAERGRGHALSQPALNALEAALAAGDQALIFINRRGYAPVLSCEACGWVSRCEHCSAWRVLHRRVAEPTPPPGAEAAAPAPSAGAPAAGLALPAAARAQHLPAQPRRREAYRLQCHHCGHSVSPPRACPECGNVGLAALGRGTQRLEEELAERFPTHQVARLDRDVAQRRGAAQRVIDAFHAGELQLLVGTQMLAKGHDFRRLSLVLVVDGDAGLFSSDFRSPERLFATLMQVAGRAGRDARASRVLIQTRFPDHPLFAHLRRHDYPGFANGLLAERREASMPPFSHQALLRAEASELERALEWLAQARRIGLDVAGERADVQLFDPVPMTLQRLKGRERAQLLVESRSRAVLHEFIRTWLAELESPANRVAWQLEIDPAEI